MVIPRGAVTETLSLFGILFCLVLLYDIVALIRPDRSSFSEVRARESGNRRFMVWQP